MELPHRSSAHQFSYQMLNRHEHAQLNTIMLRTKSSTQKSSMQIRLSHSAIVPLSAHQNNEIVEFNNNKPANNIQNHVVFVFTNVVTKSLKNRRDFSGM